MKRIDWFFLTGWPDDNHFQSSILSMKYSILHKIAIKTLIPRLHISFVSEELAILMFFVGIGEPFGMGKVIYKVIVSNANFEYAYGVLPFLSLIFRRIYLKRMKCWRLPRNQLGFSIVFVDKHSKDIEEAPATCTSLTLVTDVVITGSPANNVKLFHFLSFELMQVRNEERRLLKKRSNLILKIKIWI